MMRNLIAWAVRHARRNHRVLQVTNYDEQVGFIRFCPFWREEIIGNSGHHYNRFQWWRPFNILLHHWRPADEEAFHDHPRWNVTIVLQGSLIERTPWKQRQLFPGSIVFRSHRSIHAFTVPESAWTLFIVGPRIHTQRWYAIEDY